MAIKLITPAATDPITLAEAKKHLRVTDDDYDAYIEALITAATRHAEEWTGRAFVDQTWEITLDTFPTNAIELAKPPLIEVVSVVYDDGDGNETTYSPSGYVVDAVSEPAWVVVSGSGNWPTVYDGINAVRVRFRAGYVDAGNSPAVGEVPKDILHAILLEVGTFYGQRETIVVGTNVAAIPAWEALLRSHRVLRGMA
jgi:uncharacterized phiE125 gp8 family phage protein